MPTDLTTQISLSLSPSSSHTHTHVQREIRSCQGHQEARDALLFEF
jgi:hypothetical protein